MVKMIVEKLWDDKNVTEKNINTKKNRLNDHDLEELREHIDLISFNISKVYRHAKDRSRKEYNKAKNSKKFHHPYKDEKSGFSA